MSQRAKKGNILSFYKPVQRTLTPESSQASSINPPSPLPPSSPFGQGISPSKAKTPLARDLVIQASDDEDDDGFDSDNSLQDLCELLNQERPKIALSASRSTQNPYATPRAKRTAVAFSASPLTIMSKHKFDLKALAKDAKQDDAIKASSMKAKALAECDNSSDEVITTGQVSRSTLEDIVKDKGGHERVMRTVQRTEGTRSQLRYCFFEQSYTPPDSKPAPKKHTKGPWRLLTQGNIPTREQHLASGLPLTILMARVRLPDDLFNWILDEVCVQKSALIRREYCNLLINSGEQVQSVMTPQRLEGVFLRLGASTKFREWEAELCTSRPSREPYQDRDWSNLISFLSLLGAVASHLSLESAIFAVQALLQMSLDKFLLNNIDVLVDYEAAIQSLVDAIPRSSWDSFCTKTCSLLHTIVKPQSLRVNALLCLPASNTKVHELRRRLALTFLFNDPTLSRRHPDDVVKPGVFIDRIFGGDFRIGPKTDFTELRAYVLLLNIAIDDGSFVATVDPEDEKAFNAEIDELAVGLRDMWRKINDTGMKLARTEAKSVIEWVEKRLSHSVRTRRKAKKNVFDMPEEKEDAFLSRQQDYMRNFLKEGKE